MGEFLSSATFYLEFAVCMAIWIGLACLLVAGVERVLFSIVDRRPPEKFVPPAPIVDLPHLQQESSGSN